MNIIISGYGKMGKMVEAIANERGHEIVAVVDNDSEWNKLKNIHPENSVVIDFSMPQVVIQNILKCFNLGLPVVVGTTGWDKKLSEIENACQLENGTLFYSANFSLGVNIYFYLNKILAKIMAKTPNYQCEVSETHHIHKLDSPSGTALHLVNDILAVNKKYKKWENNETNNPGILPVISYRQGEVPGTHMVKYDSDVDEIIIQHTAKNRKGFAVGAVMAAEFILNKKGIFTMPDLLKDIGI